MIIEAGGEFILPYISADIINNGAAAGDTDYIITRGILMAAIALIMLAAGVLGANFAIRGSSRLAAGVREDTFRKIQKFSFSNIDDFSTGSLITRITNDITQIQNFTQTLLRGFFRSPVMLIGAMVMSYTLNRRLAHIIFIVVPMLAIAIAAIIITASPRYTVMQQKIDTLNNSVEETITNERVIKSFVREEYEKKKFSVINSNLAQKSISALKMMILLQPVSALAINTTTLLVVWFAGQQIMVGGMEIGTLTAFITYLSQILTALNFLANIVLQGTRAAASDRRITEVLQAKTDLNDEHAAYPDRHITQGSIEFKNVSFRYFKNSKRNVLDNISFTINAGETIGIIGSTGSGKSTLVSLISRLYDADEGTVYIDKTDVKDYSLFNLREGVAQVLQKNTLFSGTIAENLRWGNENASDEELINAAKTAAAHDFIEGLQNGYETELGQGGVNLSGGQKQRLCIARALLKKPCILILDDSTSAVDTATESYIRNALKNNLPKITKIIIAQRITSVVDADRIIVLDDGKLVGYGTHDELLNTCVPYSEIYYSQKDKEAM
jgi:ATP-binding cassette subfamily B protein